MRDRTSPKQDTNEQPSFWNTALSNVGAALSVAGAFITLWVYFISVSKPVFVFTPDHIYFYATPFHASAKSSIPLSLYTDFAIPLTYSNFSPNTSRSFFQEKIRVEWLDKSGKVIRALHADAGNWRDIDTTGGWTFKGSAHPFSIPPSITDFHITEFFPTVEERYLYRDELARYVANHAMTTIRFTIYPIQINDEGVIPNLREMDTQNQKLICDIDLTDPTRRETFSTLLHTPETALISETCNTASQSKHYPSHLELNAKHPITSLLPFLPRGLIAHLPDWL